jgi:VIT1/CCC1 family predicted Fe2+/Mn2+ transporter
MRRALKTGLCFGMTSGIITTLGLMVGLEAGTNSALAVIGGVITIAIADAFSDALGIHVSEESDNKNTCHQVWESTFSTFITKSLVAASFILPILFLNLVDAVLISVVWGFLLLGALSVYIAGLNKKRVLPVILEHVGIATAVIIATHYIGKLISAVFS